MKTPNFTQIMLDLKEKAYNPQKTTKDQKRP